MSKTSQAALALRALHPEDRAWMLSQLSPGEKESIHAYVSQSDSASPSSAQNFELAVAREERKALPGSTIVTRLNALDPFQIAYTLKHEPDWVVALIIDTHRWPWHNLVLDYLGLERKNRITRISYVQPPHRLIDSMLKALHERALAVPIRSLPTPTVSRTVQSNWATFQRKLSEIITWAR